MICTLVREELPDETLRRSATGFENRRTAIDTWTIWYG